MTRVPSEILLEHPKSPRISFDRRACSNTLLTLRGIIDINSVVFFSAQNPQNIAP